MKLFFKRTWPFKILVHYHQIVWKSSLRVACGVAYNTDTKETYIVARYAPQGGALVLPYLMSKSISI